ncbi:hypothetical protein, partial [Cronobacter sakazakii]
EHEKSQSDLQKQLTQLEKEKTALTAQSAQSIDAANKKAQALQAELDKRTAELAALQKAGSEHEKSQS